MSLMETGLKGSRMVMPKALAARWLGIQAPAPPFMGYVILGVLILGDFSFLICEKGIIVLILGLRGGKGLGQVKVKQGRSNCSVMEWKGN